MNSITITKQRTVFCLSFVDAEGAVCHKREYSQNVKTDRTYMLEDIEAWLDCGLAPRF